MKFINATNQTVRLFDETSQRILLELPTEPPAIETRVMDSYVVEYEDDATGAMVPVIRHDFQLLSDLPPEKDGVVYVVGWAVIQALFDAGEMRDDLIAPDTSRDSAVRDMNGRIVGVRKFRVM